jgi:arylformamidase
VSSVYHGYDQAALDRQYDNQRVVPEWERFFARYAELSAHTRRQFPSRLDVPYGDGEMQKLDIFPTDDPGAPTWIFIHGGYWKRLDKSDFSFPADSLVPHGITLVSVNYALAPAVTIAEIVREVREATRWVFEHVIEWDGDPERIFVGGHSAGGHLAAMVARTEPVAGLTTISGVHDLEPLMLAYSNEWLRLGPEDVATLSPIHQLPDRRIPLVACAGVEETDEFKRQTAILAQAWRTREYPCIELYRERENHFSIVFELAYPESAIAQAVVGQCLEAVSV